MEMNKEDKIFDTAFRILEILKYLLKENLSKSDLIKKLSNQEKMSNVYSFEAFIKYFNTMNYVGLNIEKDKNFYRLKKALYGIKLKKEEKDLLLEIIENLHLLNNDRSEDVIKDVFIKLVKYIDDENFDEELVKKIFEKSKEKSALSLNNNLIASLKQIINDNPQVKLEYLSKNKSVNALVVELKEIKEKNNNVFIKCFVPSIGRNKNICVESIISISNIPSQKKLNSMKQAVIFEVYGRLSALYKLKPSEKVINFQKNCLTISNLEEDRDILMRRLLKYGENCKIIGPEDFKEEFLLMVDNILSKLEV